MCVSRLILISCIASIMDRFLPLLPFLQPAGLNRQLCRIGSIGSTVQYYYLYSVSNQIVYQYI